MTSIEKYLEEFLVDFDNCENVDKMLDSRVWGNLIQDTSLWKRVLEHPDEEPLKEFFRSLDEDERKLYFGFAVECMCNFVQVNFTGPPLPETFDELLNEKMFSDVDFKAWMIVNSEEVNVNVKYPLLLWAAIALFKCCELNPVLNLWWRWRSLMIHQLILEELSPMLLLMVDNLHEEIQSLKLEGRIKARFEIEQAQLYNVFRNVPKSEAHITTARKLLGVNYEFVGKLGKRTKFQEKDIAQLSITYNQDSGIERPPVHIFDVPASVKLSDDVRLDTISFAKKEQELQIPDTEQKLLLAVVQGLFISKPQDDLYYEEVKPFLDLVLSQNNTWTVRAMVLLQRCKLEAKHKRTIERSLLQCEEIIHCIAKKTPHPLNRVSGVYSTNFPPIWKVQAELAELMLNLGMVKASLDLYLQLQLWEEVIVCYTLLKMRHKAAEVINQQLSIKPTVKLWCLLGDATDDISCYEKAWELSNKSSSRAQRHWGQFLFARRQYEECIPHFERSLSINPLQATVWSRLGYAALETENWQIAATAYRRYTTLEPGSFEVWNNLARAYIEFGNKHSAHQALLEALKCSFDNWKVWDNLMIVSADIAHYSDVILAYHRILDLKGKHLDVEVLGALVYGVCSNVNDSEGRPAGRMMQRASELLGRVTSIYPTAGHAWELYASLAPSVLLRGQRLQRALRGFQQSGWEKSPSTCQQVLYICHKLAEVALNDQIDSTDSFINSVKLSVASAIAAVKKQNFAENRSLLTDAEGFLAQLVKKLNCGNVKPENRE